MKLIFILVSVHFISSHEREGLIQCPKSCICLESFVDCSNKDLIQVPPDIPPWTKVLDLSNNSLDGNGVLNSLKNYSDLKQLNLNNNKISRISKDTFDGLKKLKDLKLSKNYLSHLGKDIFKELSSLRVLDLNRNKFTRIEGLTFKGLDSLVELKIRQNYVLSLEDGSFYGLQSLKILKLDHNKIRNVSKGWTYGLTSLEELYLGMNNIRFIEKDSWDACKYLKTLHLANNELSDINYHSFEHLTSLVKLKLNNNLIKFIQEGAFNATPSLKILDLGNNHISWLIEDTSGVFVGLKDLKVLSLASNEITSIHHKAFYGLNSLSELDLTGNHIKTIQENAFLNMHLSTLLMNTSSFICDCSLAWFKLWLSNNKLTLSNSSCAYPEPLKGKNITSIPAQVFLCSKNESPKPIITRGPEPTTTVSGSSINISCSAWSSSNSTLNFKWKQNNNDVDPRNSVTINNTAVLHISYVLLSHAGKYQCIVSNEFGIVYSKKATLKVLVLPVMIKTPGNLTVKAGSTAKLECSATGEPPPEVSWKKDGGIEFPAAQERRMHVMPSDDVFFFIVNAKPIDSGLYSCIAQNSAGTVMANATLTVQEAPTIIKKMEDKEVKIGMSTVFECMGSGWPKPNIRWLKDGVLLKSSYRHFLTANDQLLIITDVKDNDAGTYQCEMSNLLGIEKTAAHLSIKSAFSASCNDITGVIIISLVCCTVGTSAVWVVIIYQTRKHLSRNNVSKDATNLRTNVDNKSDNSSTSKDSGTGNSTKRSTEDFHLDVITTHDSPVETFEIQEPVSQVHEPLLQNNCCSELHGACCCSSLQREQTRSNHNRCKSERPFSTPNNKAEIPEVSIHANKSYSCLYSHPKPTAV